MSLSWMCSNKIILKQAVDIQWFINTFRWVLRPLIFYQECTPSHLLERSVEDRCNGCTSGLVVAPVQLPSQCKSCQPLWILFSGCLAAEFVFQDKDGHMKSWVWWGKVEGARQDLEDNSLKEQSRRRDKGSQIEKLSSNSSCSLIRVHSSDYQLLRFIYKIALFDIKLEQVQNLKMSLSKLEANGESIYFQR